MYKIKRFSQEDQREFGNKQNKEMTRAWKRQQAAVSNGLGSHTFELATEMNKPGVSMTGNKARSAAKAEQALSDFNSKNQSLTNLKTDINNMNLNERINARSGQNVNKSYYGDNARKIARDRVNKKVSASNVKTTVTTPKPTVSKVSHNLGSELKTGKTAISGIKMGIGGKAALIGGGLLAAGGLAYGLSRKNKTE